MKRITGVLIVVSLFVAGNAWSASAFFGAQIERVLHTSDDAYGGCMAQLSVSLASQGLDCSRNWVTFSCTGDFASRQAAKTNFEMAQLALVTGREVLLVADDSRQHNSYCFVSRVDLVR